MKTRWPEKAGLHSRERNKVNSMYQEKLGGEFLVSSHHHQEPAVSTALTFHSFHGSMIPW